MIRSAKKADVAGGTTRERFNGTPGARSGKILGGCQSCQQDSDSGNPVASAHQKRTPRRLFPLIMQLRMSITQPKRLFREKFGREPGPEDPLFFNLVSSVPEFLNAESQDETWRALVQAAGESGMDPALVYAMNKTGGSLPSTTCGF